MAGPAGGVPVLTRRHSVGAPSARSLLLTVLGEFVLPADRPVWTSALVDVLGGLGVEEKAARQSMARTAADGWLTAVRSGRRTCWELTGPGRRLLTEGAERIYGFAAEGPAWDGRWLVLALTVPESERRVRHQLRTRLSWAGFGSPATGLWVSPHPAREAEAKQILADLGVGGGASSFIGEFGGIGSAAYLVEQAWPLRDLAAEYERFLAEFDAARPDPGRATLLAQVRLVHAWRRFPFLDPQLPADLLPADWAGRRAATLFSARHTAWHPEAQRHWREALAGEDRAGRRSMGQPRP